MEGFKVRCRTCGQVMYETTAKYTCHKPLTGDMLRLLPLYKDWPTYDGSLAISSTPRFLMFCTMCAGYITHIDRLQFADFPDEKVHVISQERSEMGYGKVGDIPGLHIVENMVGDVAEIIDDLILPNALDSALSDDPKRDETPTVSPEDLIKEMEKQGNTSRSKRLSFQALPKGKKGKRK